MKLGNPGACVAPEHGGSYFTTSAPTLHKAVFLQGRPKLRSIRF